MLSMRAVSRAIPKLSTRPILSSFRPLATASRTGFLQSTFRSLQRPAYSPFTTSSISREPAGESDQELSAKFDSEQRLETESVDSSTLRPNLQEYITNGPFEIKDIEGTENVVLSRNYGNETIKVEFNISSLTMPDEQGMEEDTAMEDEDAFDEIEPESKRTIHQSGARGGNVDVTAEDKIAPADRDEDLAAGEEEAMAAYPVDLQITITKPNAGAVQIGAQVVDGRVQIEQVHFFSEAGLADPLTHEDGRRQEMVYAGPPFENLDEELQSMLERYVEERGIDTSLATFVPDYVDYKEQREYVKWLDNMKNFIDT